MLKHGSACRIYDHKDEYYLEIPGYVWLSSSSPLVELSVYLIDFYVYKMREWIPPLQTCGIVWSSAINLNLYIVVMPLLWDVIISCYWFKCVGLLIFYFTCIFVLGFIMLDSSGYSLLAGFILNWLFDLQIYWYSSSWSTRFVMDSLLVKKERKFRSTWHPRGNVNYTSLVINTWILYDLFVDVQFWTQESTHVQLLTLRVLSSVALIYM